MVAAKKLLLESKNKREKDLHEKLLVLKEKQIIKDKRAAYIKPLTLTPGKSLNRRKKITPSYDDQEDPNTNHVRQRSDNNSNDLQARIELFNQNRISSK